MTAVLEGVRILEVAEHTFVPAASAALADLGAEVIKIEHVERGDAMRGLASTGIALVSSDVHALLEHSNRGKRSLGLNLASPEGLAILYRLAETADVFLTNKLPSVRDKLKIGVEDIRAQNPNIIYVRGTGQGERGPDADKGSYDSLAFWARAGIAAGAKRPEYDLVPVPPAPGFGDSIGGMTIAGGIMGALYHRERTGEATVVDVSLFGVGLWAMGQAVALSLQLGVGWAPPPASRLSSNPLSRNYVTKDNRVLAFTCLQAGRTGRRCARPSGARSWPPTSASATTRPSGQQRPGGGHLERGLRLGHAGGVAGAARRLLGPVGGRPGHPRGGGRSPGRRQRLRPGVPNGGRDPVPAGHRPRPVRRGAGGPPAGAGVQRARRRRSRRARPLRRGDRRPQGPRRRGLRARRRCGAGLSCSEPNNVMPERARMTR